MLQKVSVKTVLTDAMPKRPPCGCGLLIERFVVLVLNGKGLTLILKKSVLCVCVSRVFMLLLLRVVLGFDLLRDTMDGFPVPAMVHRVCTCDAFVFLS